MVGFTISHYEITEKLGEGGMGVVYKALDTKLKRPVALKFLRADVVEDAEAKERFLREAQAAAALDHPNICTVFEIDEAEGQTFLAMAFVAGRTVQDKISDRPLKLDEVIDIATQTAEGLKAAHSQGVVHRDIKPANLMLTEEGQVKIMDFGLAQLAEQSRLTKTATILGTPAYMSPEQTRRKPTDRRTDVWSLGVVIYEMVTGRLPFAGERQEAVLYAIGNEDPEPITALRAGLPIELDFIVGKALARDAADRYQQVEEMIVDLRALERRTESGGATRPSSRPVTAASWERPERSRRRRLAWAGAVAAIVLTIAGAALWNFLPTTVAPLEPMRPVPLTSYAGVEMLPSFSPDGNQVAFAWTGGNTESFDIYVKGVGPGPPLQLTTHPDWDASPAWSPDGRWIAFLRGFPDAGEKMGLYLIPPLGGTERKLAETRVPAAIMLGTCLAWSPDSRWLAVCDWAEDSPGRLSVFLLSVDSGERRRLTRPPEDSGLGDVLPAFSPDGRTLAFSRYSSVFKADLHLLDLDEDLNPRGEPRRRTFMEQLSFGGFTSDGGDIVFSAGSMTNYSLWRVPVSGTASPERLPFGEVGLGPQLSRQGNRLAYSVPNLNINIYRLNLPVADGVTGAAVKLIASSRYDAAPRYSPDGNRIAFLSYRSGASEIWTCDSDGSNPAQLTSLGAPTTGAPRWAPDGKRIGFSSNAEGQFHVYVVDAEGGAPRRLTSEPSMESAPSWSRNGEWIYFTSDRSGFPQNFKMPAGGGPAQVVTAGRGPRMESPDGKWFYFVRGANHSVWRMPVEGGGEEDAEQVLESVYVGSYEVVEDGVYFVPPSKGAAFSLQFLRFATGAVEPIHEFERQPAGLSVAPDGRSILFGQVEPMEADLMLVENFR